MTELTLQGRIALVTGASRGIGRSSAKALATAGAHVVATARTQGGLEELDDEILASTGHRATLVPLDLLNGDGVDALGLEVHRRWGRLDVLVHAGGMLGGLTPTSHQEPKTWDKVIGANLTSAYRLARAFEPLLLKSDAGRAILLTSRVAVHPRAFWSAYAASKAGLETLGRCWADEIASTPLRITLLDPGRMRTKMRAEAYPGEDPMASPHPDEIGPLVVELARPDREPPIRVEFRTWKAQQG